MNTRENRITISKHKTFGQNTNFEGLYSLMIPSSINHALGFLSEAMEEIKNQKEKSRNMQKGFVKWFNYPSEHAQTGRKRAVVFQRME